MGGWFQPLSSADCAGALLEDNKANNNESAIAAKIPPRRAWRFFGQIVFNA
jgi:hypothetical protein